MCTCLTDYFIQNDAQQAEFENHLPPFKQPAVVKGKYSILYTFFHPFIISKDSCPILVEKEDKTPNLSKRYLC